MTTETKQQSSLSWRTLHPTVTAWRAAHKHDTVPHLYAHATQAGLRVMKPETKAGTVMCILSPNPQRVVGEWHPLDVVGDMAITFMHKDCVLKALPEWAHVPLVCTRMDSTDVFLRQPVGFEQTYACYVDIHLRWTAKNMIQFYRAYAVLPTVDVLQPPVTDLYVGAPVTVWDVTPAATDTLWPVLVDVLRRCRWAALQQHNMRSTSGLESKASDGAGKAVLVHRGHDPSFARDTRKPDNVKTWTPSAGNAKQLTLEQCWERIETLIKKCGVPVDRDHVDEDGDTDTTAKRPVRSILPRAWEGYKQLREQNPKITHKEAAEQNLEVVGKELESKQYTVWVNVPGTKEGAPLALPVMMEVSAREYACCTWLLYPPDLSPRTSYDVCFRIDLTPYVPEEASDSESDSKSDNRKRMTAKLSFVAADGGTVLWFDRSDSERIGTRLLYMAMLMMEQIGVAEATVTDAASVTCGITADDVVVSLPLSMINLIVGKKGFYEEFGWQYTVKATELSNLVLARLDKLPRPSQTPKEIDGKTVRDVLRALYSERRVAGRMILFADILRDIAKADKNFDKAWTELVASRLLMTLKLPLAKASR